MNPTIPSRRILLLLLFIVAFVGCDQTTKTIARSSLADSSPISLLSDAIRFEYVENHGAFLSLGATLPEGMRSLIFIGFVSIALLVSFWATLRTERQLRLQVRGLALITAGGIGNLLDRLFNNGAVVDFVSIGIYGIRTGIFNLADIAVTAGFFALVLQAFRQIQTSQPSDQT